MAESQNENTGNAPKRPKTPGSGRKKGSKNKRTLLIEKALATDNPLQFMKDAMQSIDLDPRTRLDAAKALASFTVPKPKDVAPGDAARLIEGTLDWTEADEQRGRDLSGRSYVPGLSPQEQAEYERLGSRKLQAEIQRRRATMSAEEIEAEERERKELGL